MNCFYHPDQVAVATCQDCAKGLCADCASRYNVPICKGCNHKRIAVEKQDILKEFLLTVAVGAALTYFYVLMYSKSEIADSMSDTNKIFVLIALFYTGCSLVAGWKTLNAITPNVFLFLPIIGWLFYFFLKLIIASFIGPLVLPFRWIRNIRRWFTLNNIKAIA